LPAVGQGALGLECRADDQELLELISPLQHEVTSICVRAERAFNAYLEGGCQVPIAGYATITQNQLHIEGRVGSVDGKTLLKEQLSGALDEGERLGVVLAEKLLAQGAGELLKALY
jgi:hydroxymethylbilane synthase